MDLPLPVIPVTSTRPRGLHGDLLEHRRQQQLAHGPDFVGNGAEGERDRAALQVDVGAEAADARHADAEVGFLAFGEFARSGAAS